MPDDATTLPPSDEARRIQCEAATEILRMLTSDFVDTTGDCQTTQRSLHLQTTMWF